MVYNGADYDPFADQLIEAAGTNPTTINVSELSGLEAQVPAGEEANEHVWYSLPTVKMLADEIAADLGAADPGQASTFTADVADFTTAIDELVAKLDAIKAAHEGERVAITDPSRSASSRPRAWSTPRPRSSPRPSRRAGRPALVVAETLAVRGVEPGQGAGSEHPGRGRRHGQVADAATAGGVPDPDETDMP